MRTISTVCELCILAEEEDWPDYVCMCACVHVITQHTHANSTKQIRSAPVAEIMRMYCRLQAGTASHACMRLRMHAYVQGINTCSYH